LRAETPTEKSHHQVGEVYGPSGVGSEEGGLEPALPIAGDAEAYLAEGCLQCAGVGAVLASPVFPNERFPLQEKEGLELLGHHFPHRLPQKRLKFALVKHGYLLPLKVSHHRVTQN